MMQSDVVRLRGTYIFALIRGGYKVENKLQTYSKSVLSKEILSKEFIRA